jgi:hypothetical protein
MKKVLHATEHMTPNRIGYNFRRNCRLTDVIEGKIEVKAMWGFIICTSDL